VTDVELIIVEEQPVVVKVEEPDSVVVKVTEEKAVKVVINEGATGPQGPQGIQGNPGPQGPPGVDGNTSIDDAIVDGVTTRAPSQNAVFDALALKAPLASPALTGNPTAPTQSPGDNSTKISTTAYVDAGLATKQPTGNYITDLTSDVVATGPGSVPATIQNDVVTNAKLANMPATTIKGNNTGVSADPIDLTSTQTTAILDNFVGDSGSGGTKGLVPAPSALDAAKNKVVRADGTWSANFNDVTPSEAVRAVSTSIARSAAAANQWIDVCWSPELKIFCAIASSGTNRSMTSKDGITWTASAIAQNNLMTSICWSPELRLFCAVSFDGTNRVQTSPDGVTWTVRTAAEANQWYKVIWAASLGIFLATSLDGTNRVMTSSDGITWTARTQSTTAQWYSVAWSPELQLFAAVALGGSVMTSPDGITWTTRTGAGTQSWYDIQWSPGLGRFCAIAVTGTPRTMYSEDGITWTGGSLTASSWRKLAWSQELGLFMALSSSGIMATSSNGITFTTRTIPEANQWYGVCYSPLLGIFCSTSITGTNRVMNSTYVKGLRHTPYPKASTTEDGYLDNTDFTTFNNKEPAVAAATTADYYRGDKTFQPLVGQAVAYTPSTPSDWSGTAPDDVKEGLDRLKTDLQYSSVGITIDGGGSEIEIGEKGYISVPFSGVITDWTIVADQSGSIVVDVWKDTYANFPPTNGDSIAGTEKPTLSSQVKNQDLTLSTWTTAVSQGDVIAFEVESASVVTRVNLIIRIRRG